MPSRTLNRNKNITPAELALLTKDATATAKNMKITLKRDPTNASGYAYVRVKTRAGSTNRYQFMLSSNLPGARKTFGRNWATAEEAALDLAVCMKVHEKLRFWEANEKSFAL
jgi:hypothetical protein